MSDTYIPKDHEIRASAIIHRAPLIHRQMLGRTLMDAEKIATAEWEAWIAAHDAQVAADALNAAADDLEATPHAWGKRAWIDVMRARATRLQEGHDG